MNRFQFVEDTLKQAAQVLLNAKKNDFKISEKKGDVRDLLTEVDLLVDNFLKQEIKNKFPTDLVLSEEDGDDSDESSKNFWTIDPIDGTSNFAKGIPHYGICISYFSNGECVLGGIINPVTSELFMVEKGVGSFLNGEKGGVSDVGELKRSVFIMSGGRKPEAREWFLQTLTKIAPEVKSLKWFGSSGLDFVFVGSGRAEACLYPQLSTFDIACAILFVQEAGGVVVGEDFETIVHKKEPQKIFVFNSQKTLEGYKLLVK